MHYDFDTSIDRRGTASMKWERYRGRDVLPLWVADMDFLSPPEVLAALHERVDHGVFGYTCPPEELQAEVVDWLAVEHGWEVDPHWLVWLPGLVTGINVACRAVGCDGDAVVTFTPAYPPFLTAPGYGRRRRIDVPLVQSGQRWVMDPEALERALPADARLLLLCSPHNPTGRIYSRRELEAVADVCRRRKMVICSDEIHCGLLLDTDRDHLPTAMLDAQTAAATITLMAPSKTFNLPGLGCSFAVVSDRDLRRRFRGAMRGIVPDINLMGYAGALAAYRHGRPWLDALHGYLRRNRDLVQAAVDRMPGLRTTLVEATYLAWIDVREAGIDDPAAFFEAAGVGLSDGRDFGRPGFVRLNFGCSRAMLTQALKRMELALDRRG